jgi:hypothetical protein
MMASLLAGLLWESVPRDSDGVSTTCGSGWVKRLECP